MRRISCEVLVVAVLGAACAKESVPDRGRTVPRPGICRVTAANRATVGRPPPIGGPTKQEGVTLQTCASNLAQGLIGAPCSCEDYHDQYPDAPSREEVDEGLRSGVYDTVVTRKCHNGGNPQLCVNGEEQLLGCANDFFDGLVVFAWPDCATIGQASGIAYKEGEFADDGVIDTDGNDDDYSFNICPLRMSVRKPDGTWMEKELREPGNFEARASFGAPGNPGRLHLETQGCRFYSGLYQIRDAPDSSNVRTYPSRLLPGDLITGSGDWVLDRYHEIDQGTPWVELHETRITAVARRSVVPADGTVSYLFVSSVFLSGTGQQDQVEIDAMVPEPSAQPPEGTVWKLTSCDPNSPLVVQKPKCSAYPARHVVVEANSTRNTCHIVVDKVNLNLEEVGRKFHDGNNCQDSCSGDFEDPGDCDRVAYAGAIRAQWTAEPKTSFSLPPQDSEDPSAQGDLWMCESCGCADPASPSLFQVAQVGCAVTGMNPLDPADRATACSQVCGDLACAPGQSCRIGVCRAPGGEGAVAAHVVGRNACTPGVPGSTHRLTTASAYHVTLTPFNAATGVGSYATFTSGAQQASNVPVQGVLSLDVGQSMEARFPQSYSILKITNLELTPDDFTLDKLTTQNKVFIAERLSARFDTSSQFVMPPQTAVLGLRSVVDGFPVGLNQENQTPAQGTFNPTTRTFSLDFQAQDVDQGDQRTMVVHLVGTVDNLPPAAVITGGGSSPLECGTPATLSAAASADADPGDAITRFQWLIDGAAGGVANQVDVLSRKLGKTAYDLRVYDKALAAGQTTKEITVVDTQAPTFTFVPPAMNVRTCAGLNIGQATATDVCGPVTIKNDAPARFTYGQTTVTWTATDVAGNTRTATQIITVDLADDPACCPLGSNVIVGTANNDVLVGTPGVDCILGLGGQDQISGKGGDDFISGGDGDDIISGDDGNDTLLGGSGQDQITGGNGNDVIIGGDGDDVCHGLVGADTIHGNQGQDRLFGEDGNDSLFGDEGDDTLDGGPGNDLLNGNGLHDVCIGGTGTNTFVACQTRR